MSIAEKLVQIAQNEQKVYDKGYINGRNTMISRSFKSIDDEALTKVGNYAFAGMPIESIRLPNVNNASKYSFRGCTFLTEIDLPNLVQLNSKGEYTFAYCENVIRYNLPKLCKSGSSASAGQLVRTFEGNYSLERLELKNDVIISTHCFRNCKALKTLIVGASTSLQDTTAFNGTPIKNGGGYIYVPDDKVATFKAATNWVAFASQIKGYSELQAE